MAILLADIGGTNARFRWLSKGKISPLFTCCCDNFKSVYDLISYFVQQNKYKLSGIVLAGAGPVNNGFLRWTNRPKWQVSEKELKKKYSLKKVLVVNDVQAQGEGLKKLYKCDQNSILMTAGTGLGGCFILNGKVISGEVGQIKTESGLKIEKTVSGKGIVYLYHCFGGDKKINSAHQIDDLRQGKDKIAVKTYQTFYQKWGQFSAQLATAFCAKGGVFLWGGLIPKNAKDKKDFYTSYQKNLPPIFKKFSAHFITDKNLAFKGLMALSVREFGQS